MVWGGLRLPRESFSYPQCWLFFLRSSASTHTLLEHHSWIKPSHFLLIVFSFTLDSLDFQWVHPVFCLSKLINNQPKSRTVPNSCGSMIFIFYILLFINEYRYIFNSLCVSLLHSLIIRQSISSAWITWLVGVSKADPCFFLFIFHKTQFGLIDKAIYTQRK